MTVVDIPGGTATVHYTEPIDPLYNIPVSVTLMGRKFGVREITDMEFLKHVSLWHRLIGRLVERHPGKKLKDIEVGDLIAQELPALVVEAHGTLRDFMADACGLPPEDPKLYGLPLSAFINLALACIEAQRPAIQASFSAGARLRQLVADLPAAGAGNQQPPAKAEETTTNPA
jgi:hypothetical protein